MDGWTEMDIIDADQIYVQAEEKARKHIEEEETDWSDDSLPSQKIQMKNKHLKNFLNNIL